MHQRLGKSLPVQILDAVAHLIQMILDWQGGLKFIAGGVLPAALTRRCATGASGLPILVTHNQTGLQVVIYIRGMRDGIGVCFIKVLVIQVRPVMYT